MNRRTAGKSWKEHLLAAADGTGAQTVVNFVSRLEFQDGKRKTGTQRYHGRGTVHSHSLDFLRSVGSIKLEEKLSASVPDAALDPVTRGIVVDSQLGRKRSRVPVREEPSAWDEARQKVCGRPRRAVPICVHISTEIQRRLRGRLVERRRLRLQRRAPGPV